MLSVTLHRFADQDVRKKHEVLCGGDAYRTIRGIFKVRPKSFTVCHGNVMRGGIGLAFTDMKWSRPAAHRMTARTAEEAVRERPGCLLRLKVVIWPLPDLLRNAVKCLGFNVHDVPRFFVACL